MTWLLLLWLICFGITSWAALEETKTYDGLDVFAIWAVAQVFIGAAFFWLGKK